LYLNSANHLIGKRYLKKIKITFIRTLIAILLIIIGLLLVSGVL